MKLFSFLLLLLSSLVISQSGCSKKQKQGCTDPEAYNYDSEANLDNGECRYEGRFVFWFDEITSNQLIDTGVISLDLYMRVLNTVSPTDYFGTFDPAVYWTSEPECGEANSITVTRDLGKMKMLGYEFYFLDQNGAEVFGGTRAFFADSCLKSKLIIL